MKWKPLDEREPPAVVTWFLVALTSPVWAPLVVGLWLEDTLRQYFPRPSDRWHTWFAWRPVRVWTSEASATVWLETIERRRFYGTIDYRLIGAADQRS